MRNISLIVNAGGSVKLSFQVFITHPPSHVYVEVFFFFLGPMVAEVRGQEKLNITEIKCSAQIDPAALI